MRVYCRLTGISQILNTYSSHKFNSYSEERPAIMEPSAFDPALVSDRLDWNLLRTFLTIVHERSISRAAVRLHITQPAVSLALRRLEDQLGHTLIERRGSRFRLTRAGEDVLRIATDVYGNVARLGSELGEPQDDVSGVLHLLTVSRIQSGVYDECLAAFHRHHPRVDLQVDVMRSADILDALAQKRAGIGLSLCRTPVEKLERQLFLRQRYAVFCGRHHRLFGRTGLSIDDLLGENFVSFMSDQLGDAPRRWRCFAIRRDSPVVSSPPRRAWTRSSGWCSPATGSAACRNTSWRTISRSRGCGACRRRKGWRISTCTCCGTRSGG